MRELRDNRVTRLSLKPEDVRLSTGSFELMAVPTSSPSVRPERSVSEVEGRQGSGQAPPSPEQASPKEIPALEAEMIHRILHNQGSGQTRDRFRDWVIYNAAMFLYAGGQAPSIAEGVPLAKKGLDSGAAAQKLADLASTMNPPSPQPFDKAQDRPSPSKGEGVEQPKVVHA